MRTSKQGIDQIKRHEGLRLTAYADGGGVWTIGYGSTRGVRKGMTITEAEANARLVSDLAEAERAVDRAVSVPLSQQQFDALVSLVFNIGEGAFIGSTLLKRLNEGKYHDAAAQFDRWVYDNKKKVPGLVARRKAEKDLFLDGTKRPELKPLAKSRTMTGSAVLAASGTGAVAVGVTQQIADAAPAVSVVSQVAQTAQEHPSGLLIVFGIVVVAAALYIAWARWDDRRKGIR